MSHILDANELTMFHIKPVQRLLKYHLLWDVSRLALIVYTIAMLHEC